MDILYFAKLVRLQLTEAEEKKFSKDLEKIIDYVSQLQNTDVGSVAESSELFNVVREDEKRPDSLPKSDLLLAEAPDTKDAWLKVKPIFGNDQ